LAEFQRERYDMYVAMIEAIKEESLAALFQTAFKEEAKT
jgi:preprotein translocase subunit SecA